MNAVRGYSAMRAATGAPSLRRAPAHGAATGTGISWPGLQLVFILSRRFAQHLVGIFAPGGFIVIPRIAGRMARPGSTSRFSTWWLQWAVERGASGARRNCVGAGPRVTRTASL